MPRLLNVNSYHYVRGGSDAVYFRHAEHFQGLGWDNAFFAMHHPQNEATPWSRYFADELEFGQAYGLPAKLKMASKVVYSFEAQRKLRALIEDFRPDVAHLHNIYHHLSPSILSTLKSAGVPSVMTAHDLKIACPAYKMANAGGLCERCRTSATYLPLLQHRCVKDSLAVSAIVAAESTLHRWLGSYRRNLDKIVVPSQFFKNKFVEWGWPAEAFEYIPNYVDAGRFEPRFEPGPQLLYFGRLSYEKGLPTLIRAAARARAPLQLVGTGPQEAELRALATELDAPVAFLGFRSGAELHETVRNARAVVLASKIYENAPLSVLEAYALGKPAIGTEIGGIPELILPGRTGWTVPSEDVEALAHRLAATQAAHDDDLQAMGRQARAHVEAAYSPARYIGSMLGLYGRLGVDTGIAAAS